MTLADSNVTLITCAQTLYALCNLQKINFLKAHSFFIDKPRLIWKLHNLLDNGLTQKTNCEFIKKQQK